MVVFLFLFFIIDVLLCSICDNGIFKINEYNDVNECQCNIGWYGLSCDQCEIDGVCSNELICDTSLIVGNNKRYECNTMNDMLSGIIGDKFKIECYENFCELQSYGLQIDQSIQTGEIFKYHRIFNCTIKNITSFYKLQTNEIIIKSKSSYCHCDQQSDYCSIGGYLPVILEKMEGPSEFICNLDTHNCKLKHSDFPNNIEMNCIGSGCLEERTQLPDNYFFVEEIITISLEGFIVDLLMLTLIFILLLWVFCICGENIILSIHIQHKRWDFKYLTMKIKLKLNGYYKKRAFCCGGCGGGKEYILEPISYELIFGRGLTAIMGESGCGKTTLLRKLRNTIMKGSWESGSTLLYNNINVKQINAPCHRIFGYTEVYPDVERNLKVKEELTLCQLMRTEHNFDNYEKVIAELNLSQDLNKRFDDTILSKGQCSRVRLAREILSEPLVLILDEPTGDLDPGMTIPVFNMLFKREPNGNAVTIIATHCDNDDIICSYVDYILFMKKGCVVIYGKTIEILEIIKNLKSIDKKKQRQPNKITKNIYSWLTTHTEEFKNLKHPTYFPKDENLLFKNNNTTPFVSVSIVDGIIDTEEEEDEGEEIEMNNNDESNTDDDVKHILINKKNEILSNFAPTSRCPSTQIYILTIREYLKTIRHLTPIIYILLLSLFAGITLSILCANQGINIAANQNRMGFLLIVCILFNLMSFVDLWLFDKPNDLQRYWREYKTGCYTKGVYFFVHLMLNTLKFHIIPPIIIGIMTYWIIGLHAGRFVLFLFLLIAFSIESELISIIIGCVFRDNVAKLSVSVLIYFLQILPSGLLINVETIPSWIKYCSPLFYVYESLMINEFVGLDIIIDPKGMPNIPAEGEYWLSMLGMFKKHLDFNIAMIFMFIIILTFIAQSVFKKFVFVQY